MVDAGLAWAFIRFSHKYAPNEANARENRIGIWQGTFTPPWEFRESRWNDASAQAPEGCPIKGNISSNGRIYHAPWSSWYSRTKINTAKGERWFCDEAEAVVAG